MPSLKEIKGRIASVRSTLKITSAMKLVSSAKLRKAQEAIARMRPYQQELSGMLASLGVSPKADASAEGSALILAIASNTSLCGSFNSNVISKVRGMLEEMPGSSVLALGRKLADAFRSLPAPEGLRGGALPEHPSYAFASELASALMEALEQGRFGSVILVYNHAIATGHEKVVSERLLPLKAATSDEGLTPEERWILEPSRQALLKELLPKSVKIQLFAAILDSIAAEHSARMVAMQTASDNAEKLLAELNLQYNKSRQAKITSEILDLASASRDSQ